MSNCYYKVSVTKGKHEATVLWWEKDYKSFEQSIQLLYDVAKVDAVECEIINKQEYESLAV
jgi:hypothetical protein